MLSLAVVAAGCQSTTPLRLAISDYYAGRFSNGFERANALMTSARGVPQDQAGYVAGLCAYELGHLAEAELRFRVASDSTDEPTAAKSRAMLGVVLMASHQDEEAARVLQQASRELGGVDGERAARTARLALDRPSRDRGRGHSTARATWRSSIGPTASRVSSTDDSGSFTLQAGAFRQRARADRAANDLRALARRYSLGAVQVIPAPDQLGKTYFLVQFGRFESRREAAKMRSRIGDDDYIVAQAAGG